MTTKKCLDCYKTKDIKDFHRNCRMSDGYLNHCKECKKLRKGVARESPTEKKCNGCQEVKPIDEFYKQKTGWHSKCIICFREICKQRYRNKMKIKAEEEAEVKAKDVKTDNE